MPLTCIHVYGQDPFRLELAGYYITPTGALELRVEEEGEKMPQTIGVLGPQEWRYFHVPEMPGWPCELDGEGEE